MLAATVICCPPAHLCGSSKGCGEGQTAVYEHGVGPEPSAPRGRLWYVGVMPYGVEGVGSSLLHRCSGFRASGSLARLLSYASRRVSI